MHVAFRVDASSIIGTGHFMRCLTLAEGLKRRGASIRFVSRELQPHLGDMLVAKGIDFMPLNKENEAAPSSTEDLAHSNWLGTSQARDAEATMRALSDHAWDWIIVDHYALDARWERALRTTVKQIMAIDDLADRQHDCDVLLDQNFYADMKTRYADKVPAHCELLMGPRYALLREEFRRLHEQIKPRTGRVKNILVFFGGVDIDNYTGRGIEALSEIGISDLHVDVVVGAHHPCLIQIKEACVQQGFYCHVQTTKMAELMAEADLAIGAGGSATWERCCLGLPAFVLCTADNQLGQVKDAAQNGLLYSPELTGDLTQSIKRHVSALIENGSLRQLLSYNGMQTVNGYGVSRVLASMGCNGIEIRTATLDDSEKLFNWRNHPSIRAVSRNTGLIAWQDHQQWLASTMADSKRILLIGEDAGDPVGVVRFDVQNENAEISIYLIPEKAGSGLGRNLLRCAELWLVLHYPEISKIRAHVLGANERSSQFFSKAGYQIVSTDYSKRLH